jgi:hypothetical protein
MGTSSINGPFSMAMLNFQRVILCGPSHFVERTGVFAWLKRTMLSLGSFITSRGTSSGKSCPGYATLIGSF